MLPEIEGAYQERVRHVGLWMKTTDRQGSQGSQFNSRIRFAAFPGRLVSLHIGV